MSRWISKLLVTVLAAAVALSLASCGVQAPQSEAWSVWSTWNTTKVIQQADRNQSYDRLEPQLQVEMIRGEYEGAQLILTADQELSYRLLPGPLQTEQGAVFPVENIAIYHQKYQTIASNFNGDPAFQAGDSIPDMLLPMETAVAYGENRVAAGSNQGITVEFCSEDVAPGVYTGSFTLEAGSQTEQIPVRVEVWDIQYTGRREFQSCFVLYRDELFVSEFRCDDQLVDAYVQKLLDYKINTYVIQDTTPQSFVEDTQRLFADDNYNSIAIPYRFPWIYHTYENGQITQPAQEAADYIKALAKASTPENNYIAYAYLYLGFLDEADVNENSQVSSEAFLKDGGDYQQLLQLVVDQLEQEGWFASQTPEFAAQVKASILQLPPIFTNVNYMPQWVGTLNAAFCPYLSVYQDTAVLNRYQEAAVSRSNGNLWLYTCCGPVDPYPTFHIDDGTLDKRVCGWMLKAYGITGYLYYKVNNYAYLMSGPDQAYIDVYATPARYYDVNGDGFLLYPGRYYGSDEPFSTLRLAAYRDGMDEYDMLCVYEDLLAGYAQAQGLGDASFTAYVEDLYHSLFQNMVSTQDPQALYAARRELANRILALQTHGTLLYDPAQAQQVNLTQYPQGWQEVTIVSQYKDTDQSIGSKTKMFQPSYCLPVEAPQGGRILCFTYENTGTQEISMQLRLVTDTGTRSLGSSFCGAGQTRQVRLALPEDLGQVTRLELVFDNVQINDAGQTVLMPQRVFRISDVTIIY